MNNSVLINNLKQKSNFNRQTSINQPSTFSQNQSSDVSDLNTKYNPDVEQNYSNAESKRKSNDFQYSTNMWKPIIGSINKENITTEDLKISIDQPDHILIKSKYEVELEERNKEKELAEKLAEEYAKVNNLNNPITEEIRKPIEIKQEDLNNMSNIDNTFIELKSSAQDMLNNTNNLDINTLMDSMSKLDDLLNSVKNL